METNEPESRLNAAEKASEVDQMKLQMMLQRIRDNQNLSLASLGGAAAAVVGAGLWAAVTAVTSWQIGFMAVGVGFLVGYTVRRLGQGIDTSFGVVGAALSLAGCLLGNYLAVCVMIARQENIAFFEVLSSVDFQTAIDIMAETFNVMDLLFYGLALYYGYKYSFRQLTPEEMASVARK